MLDQAPYFYWTDSGVVLKWLRKQCGTLKIFVANRIDKIKEIVDVNEVRHVVSEQNPADLLTRGITVSALIHQRLWWTGPEFFRESRTGWPTWDHQKDDRKVAQAEAVKMEQKGKAPSSVVCLTYFEQNRCQELIEKYSSFHRLCVVTAYVFRFLNGLCRKYQYSPRRANPVYALYHNQIEIGTAPAEHAIRTRGQAQGIGLPHLSTAEIDHARKYWLRKSQQESLPEEYQRLVKGR